MITTARERSLVLVGAGHAHLQALLAFATAPSPCRVILVVDRPISIYSGMVPGLLAGQYRLDELQIDAAALAHRAGAQLVIAPFRRIDVVRKLVLPEGHPAIAYDFASFDVGASLKGLELPGIGEHALALRPLDRFAAQIGALGHAPHIVVAGGGAAGVELAACARARLGAAATITVVHSGSDLPSARARALRTRGVQIVTGRRISSASAAQVHLQDGSVLPCDALIWATGAAPYAWLRASGLPAGADGFIPVRETLQVQGHDDLFAVGDCASFVDFPDIPKAGVHAVRAAPVLAHNLRAVLAGRASKAHQPPTDFLRLLNLGDGRALGEKHGLAFEGRWVMHCKDRIDRRFVARFRSGPENGAAAGNIAPGR